MPAGLDPPTSGLSFFPPHVFSVRPCSHPEFVGSRRASADLWFVCVPLTSKFLPGAPELQIVTTLLGDSCSQAHRAEVEPL
jgi:hypothetical protein